MNNLLNVVFEVTMETNASLTEPEIEYPAAADAKNDENGCLSSFKQCCMWPWSLIGHIATGFATNCCLYGTSCL